MRKLLLSLLASLLLLTAAFGQRHRTSRVYHGGGRHTGSHDRHRHGRHRLSLRERRERAMRVL